MLEKKRNTYGAKIREERKRQKIKGVQLAEAIHTSPGYLSDIESGRSNPSVETLQRIATALGVTTDYLMGREEIKKDAPDGQKTAEGVHIIASNNRNVGSITQTVTNTAAAHQPADGRLENSDVETILRIRSENPELLKLLCAGLSDEQIKTIAHALIRGE